MMTLAKFKGGGFDLKTYNKRMCFIMENSIFIHSEQWSGDPVAQILLQFPLSKSIKRSDDDAQISRF
jgi:hypothetical protein